MWPDWASRQLETSPCTEMSVKFLARRSRILPVNSLTVNVLRSGMRLKVRCCVIEDQCRRLSKIRRGNNARVPRRCATNSWVSAGPGRAILPEFLPAATHPATAHRDDGVGAPDGPV